MDKNFPKERSFHFRNILTTYLYAVSGRYEAFLIAAADRSLAFTQRLGSPEICNVQDAVTTPE